MEVSLDREAHHNERSTGPSSCSDHDANAPQRRCQQLPATCQGLARTTLSS